MKKIDKQVDMCEILPKNLIALAKICPKPLYLVGGAVRDHLLSLSSKSKDWDICSPMLAEEFSTFAKENGFSVKSVFRNTGTVKMQDIDGVEYEYACFRSDKYIRGVHQPVETCFTEDIALDALRRDFTANAIYYDIKNEEFCDPLNGISAIRENRLSTVAPAEKVFGADGLRLMRLARQSAQTGLIPDEDCLYGATKNASLINDVSPERIYTELTAILHADEKFGVINGHYQGLKILEQTGVLARILPELTLGKDMAQRSDFHDHDVLEHTLRAVKYAHPTVRLSALLHDIGKPYCKINEGKYHNHPIEGARLAKDVLQRLKAPKKVTERVCDLVFWHMYDMDCKTNENKLRRFLVSHADILEELLLLKQADFSACKDDLSTAPTVLRWQELLTRMRAEKVPFSLRELAIKGKNLIDLGIPPKSVSEILHALLMHLAIFPQDNQAERLQKLALSEHSSRIQHS